MPTLPLAHQITQKKLQACTAPGLPHLGQTIASHDLVDLIAMDGYTGDHRDIKTAAVRLFSSRDGHRGSRRSPARDGWADRHPQEAADLDVIDDLDPAIAWTNDLVAKIENA